MDSAQADVLWGGVMSAILNVEGDVYIPAKQSVYMVNAVIGFLMEEGYII